MSYTPPLPRGTKLGHATVDASDGGKVLLAALNGEQNLFTLRTSKDRAGVSVKLNGDETDQLIRELITARGGEWLDLLDDLNTPK